VTRSVGPRLAAAGLVLALAGAAYPALAGSDDVARAQGPVVSGAAAAPATFVKAATSPRTRIAGCREATVVSAAMRIRRPSRVLALARGAWSAGGLRAGVISVELVDASGAEVAGGVHALGSPRRHAAMTARGVLRNSAGRQYVARPGRYRLRLVARATDLNGRTACSGAAELGGGRLAHVLLGA
jgi:hypothetical protein